MRSFLFALMAVSTTAQTTLDADAQLLLSERRETVQKITSRPDAERRQKMVREKILAQIGGLPSEKTPLRARVTGTLQRDGYRVEKVIFESQPRLFVTANLYVPTRGAAPYPAVLAASGHTNEGKAGPVYQHVWISLARRGFVVLAWDPVGQGERLQYWDEAKKTSRVGIGTREHSMAGMQSLLAGVPLARYFVWDGIRAMDYLLTRPEVDASRVAAIGNSGGGTQTAYLMALEPRLAAAAPSCYITSWEELWTKPGPQDAEQNFPGFLADGLDHADFLEAFAPRPTMMLTAIQDFFPIAGARRTYAETRQFFAHFDAAARAEYFEFDDTHGYSLPRREATYRFLAKVLQHREEDGREAPVSPEPVEALNSTPTGQLANSLGGETLFTLSRAAAEKAYASRQALKVGSLQELRRLVAGRLRIPVPGARAATGAEKVIDVPGQRGSYADAQRAILVGKTGLGIRVERILQDVAAAGGPVRLRGEGTGALAALLAAFLDDRVAALEVENVLPSFQSLALAPEPRDIHDLVIPGILADFDVPDLLPHLAAKLARLPGTGAISTATDPAGRMLDGLHAWLDRRLSAPPPKGNREELARLLGVVDRRIAFDAPVLDATLVREAKAGEGDQFDVLTVRWPVLDGVDGEGLLLRPKGEPRCYAVVIPDAGEQPEDVLAPNCLTLIPVLIDRRTGYGKRPGGAAALIPHREFIYRMAFPVGRHVLGYEVQKVLAAVDWLSRQPARPIQVHGRGEGALIALYSAVLDSRITGITVADFKDLPDRPWEGPLDRNVWRGALGFDLKGLTALLAPRSMQETTVVAPPVIWSHAVDKEARHRRQFDQLVEFTQRKVREAGLRRREYWADLDTSSVARLEATVPPYRERFWSEQIGRIDVDPPGEVRSRLVYDTPLYRGYEVEIPVAGEVFAEGVLLVPKSLRPGERRPAVVCQHGLEGRPRDLIDPPDERARATYIRFAAQLAERGYVVYAPQNPYLMDDRFRSLIRKANPLGMTLYSFILPQHERMLAWLGSLGYVDPARIGFYGLSYGGRTALYVPPLLPGYALSISSGNFNRWTPKVSGIDQPWSYMFTGEYEIFEFGLAERFDHAEMAGMIAPRPFMVERGHRDGVGIDEWVNAEYAKVRRLYNQLGIGDRTAIAHFDGPHAIHGEEAFRFLDRHLRWTPER